MHARRVRPAGDHARPVRPQRSTAVRPRLRAAPAPRVESDLRRSLAALASSLIPGLGQLINGRSQLARLFAVPFLTLAAILALFVLTRSPARLFATVVSPTVMGVLLVLNIVVLVWRVAAATQAFFDGRYGGRPGRAGVAGLALVLIATVLPHGIANAWGTQAQDTFSQIFAGERSDGEGAAGGPAASPAHGPGHDERLNILIVGVDKTPWRTATLTDSMMIASIDPVGETVSLVSIPRDLVRVPLGDGNVFGPKINSLMSYADRHPEIFPQGGMRALQDALGALLGIDIHYYAKFDYLGFVKVVDAVGGIDIHVDKGFYDPEINAWGLGTTGWGVEAGDRHFNGWEALAYSRARKADGQSDFTRASRQQEVVLAVRDAVMSGGSLLVNLPALLTALGGFVETDLPTDRLPDLAAIADDMDPGAVYRAVLKRPIVMSGGNDPVYGSIQVPDYEGILEVGRLLFPEPGEEPSPWPPPKPSPAPSTAP